MIDDETQAAMLPSNPRITVAVCGSRHRREVTMPYNSPTMIARKLNLEESALKGNLCARSTEVECDKAMNTRDPDKAEKLGVLEARKHIAICDMDAQIARECASRRCHLYGVARWHEIARRLRCSFADVYAAIGNNC